MSTADEIAAFLAQERVDTSLMLDSGAFSAWNSGDVIDLEQYATFVEDNIEWIDVFFNLDVIPSSQRADHVAAAADASWVNLKRLEARGLQPLPVFHRGEDVSWLQRMTDAGYDYIGLGGMARSSPDEIKRWCDAVFEHVAPHIRLHGLGMTSPALVARYPWYSVDSISWILAASFGHILVPRMSAQGYDYARATPVSVSSDPANKRKGGGVLRGRSAQMVREYLTTLDTTFEACSAHHAERAYVNAVFYLRLGDMLRRRLYPAQSITVRAADAATRPASQHQIYLAEGGIREWSLTAHHRAASLPPHMYFACNDVVHSDVQNRARVDRRLVSYNDVRRASARCNGFEPYVMRGQFWGTKRGEEAPSA